jgi:hypothetical protein
MLNLTFFHSAIFTACLSGCCEVVVAAAKKKLLIAFVKHLAK